MAPDFIPVPSSSPNNLLATPWTSVNSLRPEAPPPYDASPAPTPSSPSTRVQKSRAWAQPRTKVATLPLDCPTPGYTYLHLEEDLVVPSSEHTGSSIRRVQRLASRANARFKRKTQLDDRPCASTSYKDSSGREVPLSISRGLLPGELDRPVSARYDWTRDWDFVLSAECASGPGKVWVAWVYVYMNDLPELLREGVPWGEGESLEPSLVATLPRDSERVRRFYRSWGLREPAAHPRWAVSASVEHVNFSSLAEAESALNFVNPYQLSG